MKLIVGLGNPGREYAGTRHNVGFALVDALSARFGWTGSDGFDQSARKKFEALALDGAVRQPDGSEVRAMLIKPLTFMNLSGRSVQAAMAFYQLLPSDVLIVLDDVALPCGKIRVRKGGSSGGHNGLKDIARALGTDEYPRLRIGVDPPPPRIPQRDWVLGRFSAEQQQSIEAGIKRAGDAVGVWIEKGINAAMNQFNAEEKKATNNDAVQRNDGKTG